MTTLIQKQRELFDKKFDEFLDKDDNYSDKGYGCAECGGGLITSNIKSFLTTCLIEHYEEVKKKLNPDELAERIVIEYANNTGREEIARPYIRKAAVKVLSDAISLLQDKIKELKK